MTLNEMPDDRQLALAPLDDRASTAVAERIRRDVDSGLASGQVLGTPTLFIDGIVHRGGYDPAALLAALAP
jgi:protein-disulfide isomerase